MFERRHYEKLAEFWKDQLSLREELETVQADRVELLYLRFRAMLEMSSSKFKRSLFDKATGYDY